ncbi:hypothetical protein BDZ89DRAFT_1101935 [Hymenopellis radicata]|nr:hypothetical protein BDZ89DRAFT_1101935 [Hymenopellis radicata]
MFGDLGVGEHLQSLMASRVIEKTPWRRFQFLIYVLGLFHVKMACADAVWKILIKKAAARKDTDPLSLMQCVRVLRPRETHKIKTKPGFRRMHEVIQHVGIVSRLDCWRIECGADSLDAFAESEPSWEKLTEMANALAKGYVSGPSFARERARPAAERDEVKENHDLRASLFLLYEEFTYALNWGDIGRLETTFMPWVYIFRSCGKHKYSTYLRKYLRDVHFRYPAGLKKAIRYNIIVFPKAQEGHGRGVDWVVERNNLYEKRIYGGKFSNHTKRRIIQESPLIGVFQNARIQIEKMFRINHGSGRRGSPKMQRTFKKLMQYFATHQPHRTERG